MVPMKTGWERELNADALWTNPNRDPAYAPPWPRRHPRDWEIDDAVLTLCLWLWQVANNGHMQGYRVDGGVIIKKIWVPDAEET